MNKDQSPTAPATIPSTPRLRVLGTPVTQIEKLRLAAEKDLGLKIDFITLDGTEAQRRGALAPNSFDVYDQWFHDLDLVWPAGSLMGIDIDRIGAWDDINDLPKTGRLTNRTPEVPGGDPSKRLYVQLDRSLGAAPTDQISMLPTVPLQKRPLRDSWACLCPRVLVLLLHSIRYLASQQQDCGCLRYLGIVTAIMANYAASCPKTMILRYFLNERSYR